MLANLAPMQSMDSFLDALAADIQIRLMRKPPRWTREEDRFLRDHLGWMPLSEIAAALGRTEEACKVRQVRRRMPAPSRLAGTLTGNAAAAALGADIHSICKMHRRGILRMDVTPGERGILRIPKIRLYAWAVNPDHWIYFKVERMGDKHLQKLVRLAQARWNDEWWTVGQAERFLGVKGGLLNAQYHRKRLKGKMVRWGNLWIKKSDAMQIMIYPSTYNKEGVNYYSPRADAFLLRAAKEGIPYAVIGAMAGGWSRHEVFHRLRMLGWTCPSGGTWLKGRKREKWDLPEGKPLGRRRLMKKKGKFNLGGVR